MDELLNEIRVVYPDSEINNVLAEIQASQHGSSFSARFNHNEELFLELGTELTLPKFPIHHNVHQEAPSAPYAYALKSLLQQLAQTLPEIFHGLTYYFDPAEPLKPKFYRLYKVEDSLYLYFLRIDLIYRHFQGEILEAGNNDLTPAFRTRKLFLESELIPLEAVMWELGKARAFKVRQLISNTWIGETGRGYLVHGIWMDSDLSKFFSRLVLPEGARIYPYFPLFCKYKTVCAQAVPPDPIRRKRLLPLLHRAIGFLGPEMNRIQASLKDRPFSESLSEFVELKNRVPPPWRESFRGISMKSYLNEQEQKEYQLELQSSEN